MFLFFVGVLGGAYRVSATRWVLQTVGWAALEQKFNTINFNLGPLPSLQLFGVFFPRWGLGRIGSTYAERPRKDCSLPLYDFLIPESALVLAQGQEKRDRDRTGHQPNI